MVALRLPDGAITRLVQQSATPGPLFSSQQQIDISSFSSVDFASWLALEMRDFGCIQIIDSDAVLPYSTLELIFIEAGEPMPAPTPYTWPIVIVAAADALGNAVAISDQINQWIRYFHQYPGFHSMRATVVTIGGLPVVRIYNPWGMLGTADTDQIMPAAVSVSSAIGQNVPLIPTIRGRNLGLLPITQIDTGYYYGENPYEYYIYDYINPPA
jgi:hypothetical protein